MASNDSSQGSSVVERFTPIALCLIGLILVFHPTFLSGFSKIQVDLGDTRFNNYLLEHTFRWLRGDIAHASFWDMPFFYPSPNTASYGDILLGVAPFYWIFRCFYLDPATAFQAWMICIVSLNFLAAYLLLRRAFALNIFGASIGAFVFAFGSSRISQLCHQQLVSQFWIVLALYALVKTFDAADKGSGTGVRGGIATFFIGLSLQFYSGFYHGWFFIFALGIACGWALVLSGPRKRILALSKYYVWILVCGMLWALTLVPLGLHYREVAGELGYREFADVHLLIPPLQAWIYQGPDNWFYGWMKTTSLFGGILIEEEKRLGIGLISTLLVLIGFWLRGRKPGTILFCLVSATIILLASRYPGGDTPWSFVYLYVPGAGAVRGVARIGILVLIPAALGIGFLFDKLSDQGRRNRRGGRVVGMVLALLVILEQGQTTPSFDKLITERTIERIAEPLKSHTSGCDAFVYSQIKGKWPEWKYHLDAMWVQMKIGIPTLNGHSGNYPAGWDLGKANLRNANDQDQLAKQLEGWVKSRGLDAERICWVRRVKDRKGELVDVKPCCDVVSAVWR